MTDARLQGEPEMSCPAADRWASVAAGLEPEAEKLLAHAATCQPCAAALRQSIAVLADEPVSEETARAETQFVAGLESSRPQWQHSTAERIARPSRLSVVSSRVWLPLAAALVLAVGGGGYRWWRIQNSPEQLLAKAFTAARPFDYRLPDSGYGPVKVSRGSGSAFDRPPQLTAAESRIQELLAAEPGEPRLLLLKGRAQLLEGDFDGAIESLTRANEAAPSDSSVLTDLGVAYAGRGDAEKRDVDHGHALDLLLKALKIAPGDERARFNLAITYERLSLVDQALEQWNQILASGSVEWRGEAARHKEDLEKIRQEHKKAVDSVIHDPAAFLRAFGTTGGRQFDSDNYHEAFWRDWLPAAATSKEAASAARIEADAFAAQHDDASLIAAMAAIDKTGFARIAPKLRDAIALNNSGNYDGALSAAREVAAYGDKQGVPVLSVRARLEAAYDSFRASRNQDCLDVTRDQIAVAERNSWRNLAGAAHTQHASCAQRLARTAEARAELAETEYRLNEAGLRSYALRAMGYTTSVDQMSGDVLPIWQVAPRGLRLYWKSAASPYRTQEFATNMNLAARAMGWLDAAIALQTAGVRALEQVDNPQLEALNRFYLADLYREAGNPRAGAAEYEKARARFTLMPDGPAREHANWYARLGRVEVAIDTHTESAQRGEIENLMSTVGTRSAAEQVRVRQARGLALLASNDRSGAVLALEDAVAVSQKNVSSLPNYLERVPVMEPAAPAFRALTQLLFQDDAQRAFDTWMRFQNAGLSGGGHAGFGITYAVLRGGIGVWLTRGRRVVSSRWIDNAPSIEMAARKLERASAEPGSDPTEISRLGRDLYSSLVGPEISAVDGSRETEPITIRTDSWLSGLPFAALEGPDGISLLRRRAYSLAAAPGRTSGVKTPGRDSRALIVSAPAGEMPGGARLHLLESAQREAEMVASHFARTTLLSGPAADADRIATESGSTDIFHFAGHGWANGGNGALVLPAAADGTPRFMTSAEISRQDWRKCALAVLSACLTATGEARGAVNNQSLVRALLSAGAGQVVAARWSVDSEATAAEMDGFYRKLLNGASVPEALRAAALEVPVAAKWKHPYYWAAFEVFTAD